MQPRKNYTRPFWWMLVLTVLKMALLGYIVYAVSQYSVTRAQLSSFLPQHIAIVVLLIAETIAYWYMRKWQFRRFLSRWHVGLWYAATFAILLVSMILQYSSLHLPEETMVRAHRILEAGWRIFDWSCIIIGHVFFVGAIREGIKNRKNEPENTELFESI